MGHGNQPNELEEAAQAGPVSPRLDDVWPVEPQVWPTRDYWIPEPRTRPDPDQSGQAPGREGSGTPGPSKERKPRKRGRRTLVIVLILAFLIFLLWPRAPSLGEAKMSWGAVTENQTEIRLSMPITSRAIFPFEVSDVDFDVVANGVPVGGGSLDSAAFLSPFGSDKLTFSASLGNDFVLQWWKSHIQNGEATDFRIPMSITAGLGALSFSIPYAHRSPFLTTLLTDLDKRELCHDLSPKDLASKLNIQTGEAAPKIRACIDFQQSSWEKSGLAIKTFVSFNISLDPPGPEGSVTITVERLGLELQGVPVAAIDRKIESGLPIELELNVDEEMLRQWWPKHINGPACEVSDVSISLDFQVKIPTETLRPKRPIHVANFQTGFICNQGDFDLTPRTVPTPTTVPPPFQSPTTTTAGVSSSTSPSTTTTQSPTSEIASVTLDSVEPCPDRPKTCLKTAWTAHAGESVEDQRILRKAGSGWVEWATVPADQSEWRDDPLFCSATYTYKVRLSLNDGTTVDSAERSGTTEPCGS